MGKTWKEKLHVAKEPQVLLPDKAQAGAPVGARMLIATPQLIDRYVRALPYGTFRSVPQMREDLASSHGADVTCALTTGIFLRIAAEAALEELAAGKPVGEITPFWRVVEQESALANKLSCGSNFVLEQRRSEGAPC
jgi:hypothetical protein